MESMNDIVRIAEEYESLLSSEEEMDILNPDHQCRDFKEGKKFIFEEVENVVLLKSFILL